MIHCTATREGREYKGEQIRKMHTDPPPKGRGWKQMGYSDLIHQDGCVQNMVPYDGDGIIQPREITNGAVGMNGSSRHACYIGGLDKKGKPKDTRTDEQKESLRRYVLAFLEIYPDAKVMGHNQVAAKACPCFDVPEWLRGIGVEEKNIYTE